MVSKKGMAMQQAADGQGRSQAVRGTGGVTSLRASVHHPQPAVGLLTSSDVLLMPATAGEAAPLCKGGS